MFQNNLLKCVKKSSECSNMNKENINSNEEPFLCLLHSKDSKKSSNKWSKFTKFSNKKLNSLSQWMKIKRLRKSNKQTIKQNETTSTTATTSTSTAAVNQKCRLCNTTINTKLCKQEASSCDDKLCDSSFDSVYETNSDISDSMDFSSINSEYSFDSLSSIDSIDEGFNVKESRKTKYKTLNFSPTKTSSRKSLMSKSRMVKNLTLLFDYKCDICNLYLLSGQNIDCEFDLKANKYYLREENVFSSTLISCKNKNSKLCEHDHEIKPESLLDILILQQVAYEKINNFHQFKVTHV